MPKSREAIWEKIRAKGELLKAKTKMEQIDPIVKRLKASFYIVVRNHKVDIDAIKFRPDFIAIAKHLRRRRVLDPKAMVSHIVPLRFFNLQDEEEMRLAYLPANHYWQTRGEKGNRMRMTPTPAELIQILKDETPRGETKQLINFLIERWPKANRLKSLNVQDRVLDSEKSSIQNCILNPTTYIIGQ